MVYQEEWPNDKVALDLPDKAVVAAIAVTVVVAIVAAAVAAVVAAIVVVAAAVAAVVAQIRAELVEEICPPDWWKQDCTARKVYTRSAMAV